MMYRSKLAFLPMLACGLLGGCQATDAPADEQASNLGDGFVPVCERSKHVRDSLTAATLRGCSDVTPARLLTLNRLTVELDEIALQPGDFTGLDNLRELYMFGTTKSLPAGIMAGLAGLRSLYIRELNDIGDGAFQGLKELQSLEVRGVGADLKKDFPTNALAGLGELRWIRIGNHGLDQSTADQWNGVPSEDLRGFHSFPSTAFATNRKLRLIDIAGQPNETLPSGLFAGLDDLLVVKYSALRIAPGLFDAPGLQVAWRQWSPLGVDHRYDGRGEDGVDTGPYFITPVVPRVLPHGEPCGTTGSVSDRVASCRKETSVRGQDGAPKIWRLVTRTAEGREVWHDVASMSTGYVCRSSRIRPHPRGRGPLS